ncbi:MerR family transcriptional regulator [Schaalia vaccimaxillae]|uniref:MerR family transcriptional regulator n=1 Tax=Schaalia vaccimaxillae TaxID=183916 RepID=UPI0003F5BBE3|nr:MerR family transcriptional regulator [Schaalia vaccimaxillae]
MYSIGEVSEMFNLPVSTLRYYDKEGLFPSLERRAGNRRFSEENLDALRVIECLKSSGVQIKEIKEFMRWCQQGPATYQQRKALFEARRDLVRKEIAQLQATLATLEYKCWYYDQALKDGNEERLATMTPTDLPKDVKALYEASRLAPSTTTS